MREGPEKTIPRPVSLEVRALGFSYGGRDVLSHVSFSAAGGQIVCVLGCNGAGKTTLLRCILGLEAGYRGDILLDGAPIRRMSGRRLSSAVAAIPQSSVPTFDYSVFDVVLMGRTAHLGPASLPQAKDEKMAFSTLECLGIAHLASHGYAHISGGERQLVLIARALAQRARILVMDEPTANLDFGNQFRVMRRIEALRREGYLVIMSTHNPQQALEHATTVLVLHDGGLVAQGPPGEAMTEQVLERVYGVPVGLYDVPGRDGATRRLCAPG